MPQEALIASPVAEQLRRGFRWLRFVPGLETAYRQDQFRQSLPYLRANLGIALMVMVAAVLLRRLFLSEEGSPLPDLARYAVLLPVIVLALTTTFLRDGNRLYRPVISVLAPLAMLAIVIVALATWEQGEERPFAVLILATMFVYFLVGLSFRAAVVTNLITWAAYLYGAFMSSLPTDVRTYDALILLVAIGVGATVAYTIEHARRTVWLESRMLDEVAQRDGLTGIYNRRRFDEHFANIWQHGVREHRPITLLFADIDHFKAFNDRYGHQAGDEAMKAVAAILGQFARRPLDLVARYGGEEFAIVLYDTTQAHAVEVAEQLLLVVRGLGIPHQDSSAAPVLTISVGIASVVPAANRSNSGLLQLADQALYAAKDAGRNRSHLFQEEYEHMKTGYFRRHAAEPGVPKKSQ